MMFTSEEDSNNTQSRTSRTYNVQKLLDSYPLPFNLNGGRNKLEAANYNHAHVTIPVH